MQHFDHISYCHTPIRPCIIHGVPQSNLVWHVNYSTAFSVPFCRCVQADIVLYVFKTLSSEDTMWGQIVVLSLRPHFPLLKRGWAKSIGCLNLPSVRLLLFSRTMPSNTIHIRNIKRRVPLTHIWAFRTAAQWSSIPVTVVEKTENTNPDRSGIFSSTTVMSTDEIWLLVASTQHWYAISIRLLALINNNNVELELAAYYGDKFNQAGTCY